MPLRLRAMDLDHTAGAFACCVPVQPALAATNDPAAFTGPARMPVAADECGDAAIFEFKDGRTAIFDFGIDGTEDARARGDANNRLASDIEQRVKPMAGQPTKEPRS